MFYMSGLATGYVYGRGTSWASLEVGIFTRWLEENIPLFTTIQMPQVSF